MEQSRASRISARMNARLPLTATVVLIVWSLIAIISGCSSGRRTSIPPVVFLGPANETIGANITADAKLTRVEPDPAGVELLSVSLGSMDQLISVSYVAPVAVAQGWLEGAIYVVDEASGHLYNQVPVAPVIGPLFARPKEDGQGGYCMLSNYDGLVRSGSVVTVVLGSYRREHVKVQ